MRTNTLLITVTAAALMAGGTLVSAQAPSGRDSSGAPGSGSQTQMNQGGSGSLSGQGGQMQQSPRGEPGRQGTTGQSSPSERQGQSGQTQQRPQSGQSPSATQPRQGQSGQSGPSAQQGQSGQSGTSTQQSKSAPGGGAASADITTEQRTRIRQTVMSTGSAPRVSRVDFSLSVGTAVPRTVKLAPLPATVVEIRPAWRGYMFFVVGDQIVIVHPSSHEIVAVIAA